MTYKQLYKYYQDEIDNLDCQTCREYEEGCGEEYCPAKERLDQLLVEMEGDC